ncbi:MAG: DUF421 domain-containing protein [Faecalibacterium sp.]|nr:DUF421 domain-containing protein [Faecalibacterium sp.]
MNILKVVLQSILSVAVLFILTRIMGKRSIHQMNLFDYINGITIGSIAAELATDLEEWEEPLTAMILFGLLTALIDWATCKSIPIRKFFNGKPVILYENDTILKENLLKVKIDLNEFLTQCRVAGYYDLFQLQCAIMETNGQISFLPKSDQRPVTPKDLSQKPEPETVFVSLIFDGKVLQQNLESFGKDMQWLRAELHTAGIGQISEVFFACCDACGNFRACRIPTPQKKKSIFEP